VWQLLVAVCLFAFLEVNYSIPTLTLDYDLLNAGLRDNYWREYMNFGGMYFLKKGLKARQTGCDVRACPMLSQIQTQHSFNLPTKWT
jgi:hypothetical protein